MVVKKVASRVLTVAAYLVVQSDEKKVDGLENLKDVELVDEKVYLRVAMLVDVSAEM